MMQMPDTSRAHSKRYCAVNCAAVDGRLWACAVACPAFRFTLQQVL